MNSIEKLLNEISNFKCKVDDQEIVFPGVLQKENGNIILNAKFPLEQYRKMSQTVFSVMGDISGSEISLIDCYIKSASCNLGSDYTSIIVVPNEIIIGGLFSSVPMAKK